MSKKDFLQKLKDRLRILNQHEIEDIIEEYEGHINEKVASGKTEEEAIQDFGDFDELVKEILSAYKINEDYENKIKEKNVIQDFVESCVQFFKDLIKNISKRSKEDIIKFIFEFLVLIIFIAILRLPVMFVEKLGSWIFERFMSPFGNILSFIWKYMIEIIYFVLSIVGIISFVKKRYLEGENVEEKAVKNSDERKSVKKEDNVKEVKKQKSKEKKESSKTFSKILVNMIKVFLFFVLLPAIFSFVGTLILIVIGIILLFSGLPYFGIFLCCLTYAILNYIFIDLCIRFIFDKKLNAKALLTSVLLTVILFVIGVGLSFSEVVNTSFIDGVPSKYKEITKEKTEVYTDDTNLTCNNLYHTRCHYEIDENQGDNITATVTYYDYENRSFDVTDDLKYVRKENKVYSLKDAYSTFVNDLKERKIYNYAELYQVDVTIKVSSTTKEKLIEKRNALFCEGKENCYCTDDGCYYDDLEDQTNYFEEFDYYEEF